MKHGKRNYSIARTLIATAVSACFAPLVFALPVDPTVASGSATFVQNGNVLTVTNSNQAIINWRSFSSGSDETIRFIQPSASSSVLNRVLGSDPSLLLGALQSNGRVFLINPAGILVGQGSRIDVAAFVASTLSLSDSDFLANRLRFTETPGAGKVENLGEITTASGGTVYLIAPQVDNKGIITAPNGEVLLAAGQRVELIDTATPGVRIEIIGSAGEATNLGTITATAGRIGIAGVLVKNAGTLDASSVVSEGGRIFLKATQKAELAAGSTTRADGSQGGTVLVESGDTTLVSGTVSATGRSAGGGRIELLGDKVGVLDGALADASGQNGGGTILLGGDYQGKNPDISNARISYLAAGATLKADAGTNGNGGKVIVWADDTTRAFGSISARGGAQGGNGGFVEVSGKKSLAFNARVDTGAPFGLTGTLLLDPFSVTIVNTAATPIGGASWLESSGASTLSWSSIDAQLQSTNVTITTSDSGGAGDNITFSAASGAMGASATATNTLVLNANDDIVVYTGVDLKGALSATAGGNLVISSSSQPGGAGFRSVGQSITVGGAIQLQSDSYLNNHQTYLESLGNQTIQANQISLSAGCSLAGDCTNSSATISANGNQNITVSGAGASITLQGGGQAGGSTTHGYNNQAAIQQQSASGSQKITVGNSGTVSLTGGDGDGVSGYVDPNCPTCPSSENGVRVSNKGSGGQELDFLTGGSLQLTGGTSGTRNQAQIENSSSGLQKIWSSGGTANNPAITLTGGASGGVFVAGYGVEGMADNGAGIHSDGAQIIKASSLSLTGGANATGIAPAIVSSANQTIDVTGNLTLQGGSSTAASIAGMATAAVIGYDKPATSNITVGGAFNMTAGAGAGGAAYVGTLSGTANVSIKADGIAISAPGSAASAGIGALDGSSSAVIKLEATGTGGINLGNYSQLQAGTGSVELKALAAGGASVLQSATSSIVAQTLTALGNINVGLTGLNNNVLNFTGSSTSGLLSYTANAATTHIVSASGGAGVTLTTTTASDRVLALGSVSASGASAISITANGAILDDNGSGVANVSTGSGNITLTSLTGTTNAGQLAISTDIATTGTVAASTSGGSYGSIAVRDVGTTAASVVGINGSAATTEGNVAYFRYGNLNLGGGTALTLTPLASAATAIGASGNVQVSAGMTLGGASSLLSAGGDLTIATGTVTLSGNGLLAAGGNLFVTGGNVSMGGATNAVAAGGTLNIASGKTITAGTGTLTVAAGALALSGTLSGYGNTFITTPGNIDITGGSLLSTFGNLTFAAGQMNVAQGSVSAALGIDGSTSGKLTLGVAAGGSGTINAASGIVKLMVGGAGIEMYNGSYINSTDATQAAGGLVKLYLPGLSSGGSMIDSVATFDGGYKTGGLPATIGQGLEVTYGQLSNPATSEIIGGLFKATDASATGLSAGTNAGTALLTGSGATSGSALAGTTGGTDSNSFGGSESGESASGGNKEGKDDAKNAKKKPAQCT